MMPGRQEIIEIKNPSKEALEELEKMQERKEERSKKVINEI